MKQTAKWIAVLSVLSLVLAACGDGDDNGDTGQQPTAAECSTGRLTGQALGAPETKFEGAAGTVRTLGRSQAKPTVKIGYFGDLTGANSSLVVGSREGAALAVKKANEAGNLKVNIEFEPEDNKDANPDTAPAIEQGFIQDDDVVAVIGGGFSGETRAVGDLFEDAGLVHVSPSATGVDLTKQGWPFFRVLPNDDVQGPQAGELLTNVLGCKKIAVIDDKSEYGAGLGKVVAKTVKDTGGEVVSQEGIEPTTDYTSLLDTLSANTPDAVFYAGYDSEFSLIVKQAKARGLKALMVSGDGSKGDKLLAIGDDANGAIVVCPCLDPTVSEDEAAKTFTTDFQAEYSKAPGIYAAEGWDAAQVVLNAIDASDDDGTVTREEVLNAVKAIDIQGVTKKIKFTETGEVEDQTIFAYIVENKKYSLVGPIREIGS